MRVRTANLHKGHVIALPFGRKNRTIVSVVVLNPTAPAHTQWIDVTSTDASGIEYVGRFRSDEIWTVVS